MTRLHASYTKLLVAFLLSFSVLFTQPVAFAAESVTTTSQVDGVAQYKQFLQEKFGVSLKGTITKGEFIQAVANILNLNDSEQKVNFTDLKIDNPLFTSAALTKSEAISIAVRAADMKELAYTYSAAKVNKVLHNLNKASDPLNTKVAQEIAVAVDTGLLPTSYLHNFKSSNIADEQLVNELLGRIVITKGLYKNYIGYTSDSDIYVKLRNAYLTSDIITAPKLQSLVNTALEQKLITGYSLKDNRFDPNFIDSLSLTYGHSDFKHAVQLIGLLHSEGLDAKVQFEPKTSAFVHLSEWGDPGPNVVKIANGNYIAYAKEYDLEFEFSTVQDKVAFQDVILKFAKKNKADQTGLIVSSWWQPLYYSSTPLQEYETITNNLITDKDSHYTVNPFSLNEDSAKVVKGLKAIDPEAIITPFQFWVDKPFFNYLHGEAL